MLPAKTAIADYSHYICKALSLLSELNVYSSNNGAYNIGNLNVLPLEALVQRNLNTVDFNIYQIGNDSRFHSKILELSKNNPGIIVLHDLLLLELILGSAINHDEEAVKDFVGCLSSEYGELGFLRGLAMIDGKLSATPSAERFPLFQCIVDNALGVIVHNEYLVEKIKAQNLNVPIIYLPLPWEVSKIDLYQIKRKYLLEPSNSLNLLIFGFIGKNRRLKQILSVLDKMKEYLVFHLDVAGEVADLHEIEQYLVMHKMMPFVKMHGFVSDEDLDFLIKRADLVLNLRNPTMGEASATVLKTWNNGTACVVSDVGWYASLPKHSVIHVSSENEAEDLHLLFLKLQKSKSFLYNYAVAGSENVKSHSPSLCADKINAWLSDNKDNFLEKWIARFLVKKFAHIWSDCYYKAINYTRSI